MEKNQDNHSESTPSRIDRLRAFGSRLLAADKPRYSEADRIVLAKRGAWVGETAWLIPDTASNPVSVLPHDFSTEALEPAEIKAALTLKLISRAAITQAAWDSAQEIPDKDVPNAAKSLLRKLEAHPTKN